MELLHSEITGKILQGFYHVYNTLGHGFLEKVYVHSLMITLRKYGLTVEPKARILVYFEDELVGEYFADLIVNRCVILEIKAAQSISPAHEAQLLNYLRATTIEVGLLLNFDLKPDHKRKIFENRLKKGVPIENLPTS